MPSYTFKRHDGSLFTKRLSFAEYDAVVDGSQKLVDQEDRELELVFDPGAIGFVLKDGMSGGWVSKAMKENKYRSRHSKVMAQRERDHVFKNKLVPNYQGQEGGSWSDIQDHVRSEKGVAAASTYDSLVTKEKTGATA